MIVENDNAPVASEPQPATPATITELEYGFTKNMGNFQSQRLSVTMPVDPGANPEEVLAAAQQWVNDHLSPSHDELSGSRQDFRQLELQRSALQSRINELNAMYAKLRATLGDLGLKLPENVDELPF